MSASYTLPRRQLPIAPARFSPRTGFVIGSVGLLFIAACLMWLFQITGDARRFPVNEVEVLGTLDYTDRDELRGLVVNQTLSGFYRLDIDQIRRDVKQLPWIAEAHIRRVWPDRISIEVIEHEPAARWNNDSLISKKFELFTPPQLEVDSVQRAEWLNFFATFPQLTGGPGRHEAVLSAFRTLEVYLKPHNVSVMALLEDDRQSQSFVLSNNARVNLGVTDWEERVQRFVQVYTRLVEPMGGRAVQFDMRYPNGFALSEIKS